MALNVKSELCRFLAEDLGRGDITSNLLPRKIISARIISREDGVVAGTKYVKMLFEIKGCKVKIIKKDGSKILQNQTILEITGDAKNILSCERTALNLMSRMCGIATITEKFVQKTRGTSAEIFATRKTAPGLRFFDKEAVSIGGGQRHRMRLDEMVMIKDNHIAAAGSISDLVKEAKRKYKKFEVEVESIHDAVMAANMGASIIMLDNFKPSQISKAVTQLKKEKLRHRVKLEASGGISLKNVSKYAKSGVDMISVGSITNSPKGLDLSLEV